MGRQKVQERMKKSPGGRAGDREMKRLHRKTDFKERLSKRSKLNKSSFEISFYNGGIIIRMLKATNRGRNDKRFHR